MPGRTVRRDVPFPFEDGRFPNDLGAIVQETVLDGREPIRIVIHDDENDWLVGDAVTDPSNAIVACMDDVVSVDPSVAQLATLPLGHKAERQDRDEPWRISAHAYPGE